MGSFYLILQERIHLYCLQKRCSHQLTKGVSGTQKFLCGMSINNDVSSSNYLSFSDPVGHKRLWKYLRATAPRTVYEETLCCESEGEHDIFHVKPETSDFCAGLLSNTLLLPGQEIVLSAESGLSGSVSATLAEELANSALEPPD